MVTDRTRERVERMVENYAARLNVGQCGVAANLGFKGTAERYAAAMERVTRVRARTKAFLNKLDLPWVTRPPYCSYACKLAKLIDNARGEHVPLGEARIVLMTWEARGLDRDVLMRIARELFELELGEEKPESTNQE
jgi:hypothetical protein